jgi:hypothetical protein
MTGYRILGDPAYGLKSWLLSPFKGTLTPHQRRFNKELSVMRALIERAFGRLKGRWRILMGTVPMQNRDHIVLITLACCLLYNICEERHEEYQTSAADEEYLRCQEVREIYQGTQYQPLFGTCASFQVLRDKIMADLPRLCRERREWLESLDESD